MVWVSPYVLQMICGLVAAGGKENQLKQCRRQRASPSCLPDTRGVLFIIISQELCSSETQVGYVPHTVRAFGTPRGRGWPGSGTCLLCLNVYIFSACLLEYIFSVSICAQGPIDSKLRVHLARMHKSHSRESTAGKKDGWTVHSLLISYLPSFSCGGFSAEQYCVAREMEQKEKGANCVSERESFALCITVWLSELGYLNLA